MDQPHALNALAYVELNPVRAKMVNAPARYRWSSAAVHLGTRDDDPCLELSDWRKNLTPDIWHTTLRQIMHNNDMQGAIRLHTRTGRPLASDRFISKAETLLGRRLRPLPIGRPTGWRKRQPKLK